MIEVKGPVHVKFLSAPEYLRWNPESPFLTPLLSTPLLSPSARTRTIWERTFVYRAAVSVSPGADG